MIKVVKKNSFKAIKMLVALVITLVLTSVVKATTNTDIDWNNKLTQGRDIYYWISSGNQYTVSIPQAVSKLRYPSGMRNPMILNSTSVQKQSKMDIFQYSSNDGTNASASVFRKNGSGNYYNSTGEKDKYDWVYGNININDRYMSGYDNNLKSTIILHEMLHVYGCKDISNTSSIMYYATPKVRTLTKDANTVLNNKYN